MLGQSLSVKLLVALIFLGYHSFNVESTTLRGRLRNYSFNTKCIRPVGEDNGAELEIVECSDSSADQIIGIDGFQNLERDADYIQFDLNGKCLSLNGFDSDNGVHILIWDCVDQDNQKWSIVNGNSGGSFQLQLKSTGKCLTAEGGGTYLDQWDCLGTDAAQHQSWTLDTIDLPIPMKGVLRNYKFITKCIHPVGQDNGAELEMVDCSKASTDQIIRATSFQNKVYEADYIQFDLNGKCLSLNGFDNSNGVHILIWDCAGQDNQKWNIVNGNPGGVFQLQLKSTGKCLTAEGDGTYLDQWDCVGTDGAPHQSWILDTINDGDTNEPGVPPQTEVTYKGILRNYAFNTKCMHASGGDNGAELEIVDCSESSLDQLLKMDSFQVMENEAGYIQFDVSGKCLSLNGFASDNGVHVLIWDCVNQDNQKWRIINGDFGHTFQLQLKSTGKCLTAEDGGSYLDQWDCLGTDAAPHQSWTIDKIDLIKKDVTPLTFFQLENFNSPNNCLRYKDGTASSYALELAPCDSEDPSQQMAVFTNYADPLGYTGLQFVTTTNCLDVAGESNSNGAVVGQYGCINQANQKWRMEDFQEDGTFRIRTELDAKCLTSEGSGTYMDIWDCYEKASAPHQYWKQRNPNQKKSGKKLHLLQNYKWPDKCLHPVGTSKENGGALELVDCDLIKPEESMNSNEWLNYDTTAGYIKFNGKCLSMSGFASDNGVSLVQWDCVDQANQRWKIVNGDIDTSFQLQSEQSSKCLTAEEDGTYMDQWDCLGKEAAPHQSWMIKSTGGGSEQHDDTIGTPENFFETEGALLEIADMPGKCLTVSGSGNGNEVSVADCDQFDSNQLFDDTDLLNYNTNPGLLKILGTGKCLSLSSNNHVTQQDCDITKVNEIWSVITGTLFGTFQLKTSQSLKFITPEDNGSYTDVTDCVVTVSDSRKKRSLSSRSLLRLSYKMSQPANNKLYLIRSAYFPGYCLTKGGADNWKAADVGIENCDKTNENQQWHFESVEPTFQNTFYVRNSAKCLWSKGNGVGNLIDYQNNCVDKIEYQFTFRSGGTGNSNYQLQNRASGLCMQVKWYFDDALGNYIDYIEQQPCGLVGWSQWMSIPITDPAIDFNCGPKFGGKFCSGQYLNNCCSIYGGCGMTSAYCARGNCDPNHGPCYNYFTDTLGLDQKCGPWVATLPGRNGKCAGKWAGDRYCCSNYGQCGSGPEHCLGTNCDPEYGNCPNPEKDDYPNKCGPFWGNKKCSGAYSEYCCSKDKFLGGQCGTKHTHCGPAFCDQPFGNCYGGDVCQWVGNSKKLCSKAGDCCSKWGKCGTTEAYCGRDCNVQLSCGTRCNGGTTSTAGGLKWDSEGTCRTTSCGTEGVPCTIRGWCCEGFSCVADPENSSATYKAKKCVRN